jgi:hypothetical protein
LESFILVITVEYGGKERNYDRKRRNPFFLEVHLAFIFLAEIARILKFVLTAPSRTKTCSLFILFKLLIHPPAIQHARYKL